MLKKKKSQTQPAVRGTAAQKTTRRKQTKNELRLEDELWLKNIVFETSAAANSTADNQGNINHVNAAFLRLWGYRSEAEAAGKSVASFFANDKDALPVMESLKTTGQWEGEFLAKRTDGTTFITRGLAIVIRDENGKQIGYHSSNIDVTGERRAEEELRETKVQLEQRVAERTQELQNVNEELGASNEELNAANQELQAIQEELNRQREQQQIILDSVPAWVFYKDKENRFVQVNKAFADVMGMPKQQLEGISLAEFYPRKQAEAFWQDDLKVIESGQPKRNIVESMKSPRGTLWVQTDKIPYHDAQGEIIGIIGFTVDITQRKQLEDSLKEHGAKLEALNKELESFSYSVSHDLRVPLRAIDGFTKIVTEDYDDKLDQEGKRLLGVIRDNTKKMGRLIDDLLLFSRVGRQELAGTEIDMGSLAETVSKEFKAQNEGRDIIFKIGPLPPAHGDPAMLRQVLANLVGNAVKFTRNREKALVEISGAVQGSESIYLVKDNGAGFDMQYAPKLFGVFQRLHSQEEFEGTGVGLAIVQRIIFKHGGRVWAEGRVGEGAALFFALPNLERT